MNKGKDNGFLKPDEVSVEYTHDLGNPGEFPFTRGLYPEMYRFRKPTIREFAGHGLARDTNKRFKALLEKGGTGISTIRPVKKR